MKSAVVDRSVGVGGLVRHTAWPRKTAFLAAVATLTITVSMLAATPAHAAGIDAASVEQALRQAGAVTDVAVAGSSKLAAPDASGAQIPTASAIPTDKSAASISLKSGLTVPTGMNTLSIAPVVQGGARAGTAATNGSANATALAGVAKALSPSGLAVYRNTADSSFALSKASTGGNAGYAVITGPNAPTSYQFAFTVDGQPAVLKPTAGGGVDVLSSGGAFVNSIAPAWAKDATGAELPTSYSVVGNILTQSVTHAGAVYPVVADPRVRCDSLWCTLELTRNETRGLAGGVLNVGGACAIFGPGAGPCAIVLAGAWLQASIALSRGECIGFRVWKANFVSYPHLAYTRCYA